MYNNEEMMEKGGQQFKIGDSFQPIQNKTFIDKSNTPDLRQEYLQTRRGVGICIISRGQVPIKWMMHMNNVKNCFPGGIFWKFIVVERLSWAAARNECVRSCRSNNFEWLFFCFKGDEKVETINGSVKIRNINVGDLVKTDKNRYRKVLKTYKLPIKQRDNLLWVKTSNSIIKCTPEHPFLVKYDASYMWKYASALTERDTLLYPIDYKKDIINLDVWLRNRNIRGFGIKKYHNKHIENIEIDCDIARFFGLYLAEGCGGHDSIRFTFNNKETEYVDFISNISKKLFNRMPTIHKRWATCVKINIRDLAPIFIKWFGKNAKVKRIPSFVFDWNIKNKISFLIGYLQGDGSKGKAGNCEFVTASKELANDLNTLIKQCGLSPVKIYEYTNKGGGFSKVGNKSYIGCIGKSDFSKLKDLFSGVIENNYVEIKISSIDKKSFGGSIKDRFVYNLEVEEDNTYIVGPCIVHNCDDDVFVPEHALEDLMKTGKDIISGIYWTKTETPAPVIFKEFGAGPLYNFEPNKIIPIGGSGAGCLLINMSVFDKFDEAGIPYFVENWVYTAPDGNKMKCPIGEDHYFFLKAKEFGYQAYAATGVLCDHYDHIKDKFYPGEEIVRPICQQKLIESGREDLVHSYEKQQRDPAKKTIVIYNDNVPFAGDEISKRGVGGSEHDIINLSREFIKTQNFNVRVYCKCLREGTYDNVIYKHNEKMLKELKELNCDLFISSRNMNPFLVPDFKNKYNIKQTVLWGHDLAEDNMWNNFQEALPNIDKVVLLSNFHKDNIRTKFPFLTEDKVTILRNGIEPLRYANKTQRVKGKCIYSSTPYRGLDVLLKVWPKIKARVPWAELYIFSSIKVYGEFFDDSPWEDLYNLAKRLAGVHYYGTIKQDRLAKEQMESQLLLYPNIFLETCCCTAMENQTAGTPIVSSNSGALPEIVKEGCGVLINGNAYSQEYQEAFINAAVDLLTDEAKWNKMHEECLKHDFSWKSIMAEWIKNFLESNLEVPKQTVQDRDIRFKKDLAKGQLSVDEKKFNYLKGFIKEDDKILDINCGLGAFPRFLRQAFPKAEIWGTEPSMYALDYCRQSNKTIYFANHPIENSTFEAKYFDIISYMDSFSIEDIDKIKSLIKSTGKLILALPKDLYTEESIIKIFDSYDCHLEFHKITFPIKAEYLVSITFQN